MDLRDRVVSIILDFLSTPNKKQFIIVLKTTKKTNIRYSYPDTVKMGIINPHSVVVLVPSWPTNLIIPIRSSHSMKI